MSVELFDQNNLHAMKKDVLLRMAADCFNQFGFGGTSLKFLAHRLTLTDAALYYYVKSKDELVSLCYERAMDLGESSLDRAIADGANARDALRRYIEYAVDVMLGEQGPIAVVSELAALPSKYKDPLMSRAIEQTRRVEALIEKGISEGTIAPCNARLTTDVILGALNWLPKWYRRESPISGDDIKSSFTQTFLRGMDPRPLHE
jgi:AcrR family transcriptional regulator